MAETTQYAAMGKQKGGSWQPLHPYFLLSEKEAQLFIDHHKQSFQGQQIPCEYKIVRKELTDAP